MNNIDMRFKSVKRKMTEKIKIEEKYLADKLTTECDGMGTLKERKKERKE
jgi:hypothetical protein